MVKLRAASGDPQGTHWSPTQREFTVVNEPVERRSPVDATWEPPWPRIVRKPLLLKDPQLAEELPRLEAAGKVTTPGNY